MQTNNENELRTYVQPETTEIKLETESLLAGIESGEDGGTIG